MLRAVLLVVVGLVGGYLAYHFWFSAGLRGEWLPDRQAFLAKQEKNRMTEQQKRETLALFDQISIKIGRSSIELRYPQLDGHYTYTAKPKDEHCYYLHIDKVGDSTACVYGDTMELIGFSSGKLERFYRQ